MGVNSLPKTVTRQWLRLEPRPYCALVQHANHLATEPPLHHYPLKYSLLNNRSLTFCHDDARSIGGSHLNDAHLSHAAEDTPSVRLTTSESDGRLKSTRDREEGGSHDSRRRRREMLATQQDVARTSSLYTG